MLLGLNWILLLYPTTEFQVAHSRCIGRLFSTVHDDDTNHNQLSNNDQDRPLPWMNCGVLISSFSDGVMPNEDAQIFLQRGLVNALLLEERHRLEHAVKASAIQSPCYGPDVTVLDRLQDVDRRIEQVEKYATPLDLLNAHEPVSIRLLYIPTAMYAIRSNSENTPGKQRQRARADGKKRRTRIVDVLKELIPTENTTILAATLDFDDGSVKQTEGAASQAVFPQSGKDAMRDWEPHIIYVEGGNTFWLYHCIEKGHWDEDLVRYCTGPRQGVYCGSSAGAIVAGASIETACWKGWDDPTVVPGRNGYKDWKNVTGLRLVGATSIFPHMEDRWADTVRERQEKLREPVLCLRDDEALCVSGHKQLAYVTKGAQIAS